MPMRTLARCCAIAGRLDGGRAAGGGTKLPSQRQEARRSWLDMDAAGTKSAEVAEEAFEAVDD